MNVEVTVMCPTLTRLSSKFSSTAQRPGVVSGACSQVLDGIIKTG